MKLAIWALSTDTLRHANHKVGARQAADIFEDASLADILKAPANQRLRLQCSQRMRMWLHQLLLHAVLDLCKHVLDGLVHIWGMRRQGDSLVGVEAHGGQGGSGLVLGIVPAEQGLHAKLLHLLCGKRHHVLHEVLKLSGCSALGILSVLGTFGLQVTTQQHMAGRLQQVLADTEHLNPGLSNTGGQLWFQGKPLAAHAEGVQLYSKAEGCLPGQQHYRLVTPHAISSGANLQCSFCLGLEKYLTERLMSLALHKCGFEAPTVLQWNPKWWHGRVDYYMPGWEVVMQVDGCAHFVRNPRDRDLAQLVEPDLRCNMAAWAARAKMIRVHHKDQHTTSWLPQLLAMADLQGPLLVLSPSYGDVSWWQQQMLDYVSHMQLLLAGCVKVQLSGYHWLLPTPPTL